MKTRSRKAEEKELDSLSDSDSGSESSGLMLLQESKDLEQKLLMIAGVRKRLRSQQTSCSGSDLSALSDEEAPAPKVGTSSRGRGRTPIAGEKAGLAKAKADLMGVRKEELGLQAEDGINALVKKAVTKSVEVPARPVSGEIDEACSVALMDQITNGLEIVEYVARKSGNLKGTFSKALKTATELIKKGSEGFHELKATEESAKLEAVISRLQEEKRRLREENAQLQRDLGTMREEIGGLKVEVARIGRQEVAPPAESEMVRLLREEMASMSARFGVLEGKILRPPLAGDRKAAEQPPTAASYAAKASGQSRAPAPTSAPTQDAPSKGAPVKAVPAKAAPVKAAPVKAAPAKAAPAKAASAKASTVALPTATQVVNNESPTASGSSLKAAPSQPKGKGKGKKTSPPTKEAAASTQGVRSANEPREGEWQTVTNKKKAAKKAAKKRSRQRKRAARLQVPRTSAVMIALQPSAEAKGITYASVLLEAKRRIKLEDIGISSLGFKLSVTGARILEVPGAESDKKADSLAARMRELVDADDVRISRPTKCAELRVSDLDDSVTSEEIAAVAARVGGCSADEIKVGEIRRGPSGRGSVWLRCPVAAAQAIVSAGRLLVGWVSARVTLLEPRPMQCYRCLYGGHTQHTCSSGEDRSKQCYNCSQPGHRASECSADPHCSLCAAVGKKADHRVGAKACVAFEKKKKGRATESGPRHTQSSATQAMDVTASTSAQPS